MHFTPNFRHLRVIPAILIQQQTMYLVSVLSYLFSRLKFQLNDEVSQMEWNVHQNNLKSNQFDDIGIGNYV